MEPLKHPDNFHLRAAWGWLGLGDLVSANNELDEITPELRAHPDVLVARGDIYAKAKKWGSVLTITETLVKIAPEKTYGWIHRSFALHEMKRTQEALDLLLPVAERFPKFWLVRYNLACYCAQLGRLKDARNWLETAFALGDSKQVKLMALDDKDLEPLWADIGKT
jgi:predicted Zn-dependent protease